MPDQVGADISGGIFNAIANPGLGAEMDDVVELRLTERSIQRFSIGEIRLDEAEAIAEAALELREPRLLEPGIVIIVEVVDADDVAAALEERVRRCESDEAGAAGDESGHCNRA